MVGGHGRSSALGLAAAAVVACGLAATAASAAPAYGPPAGWPSLANAALAATDLGPGATVAAQKYVKPDSPDRAEYDREFEGGRVGGKRILYAEDDVSVAASTAAAATTIVAVPLGIAIEQKQLTSQLGKSLGFKPSYVKLGKISKLGGGDDSVGVVIRIGTTAGELRLVMGFVRVQQVISAIVMVGVPRSNLGVPDLKHLAAVTATRMRTGLSPQSTVAPSVTGTPAVGQVLTAVTGTWLGSPTSYAYAWQRCDATGANCVAVPGATSSTYTVSSDDADATLRVLVSAVNAFGTAQPVASGPTGAVPPASQ